MTATKKIAMVTGGNKGIGLEICRNLAGAGCTVLLGARNAERGQEAALAFFEAWLAAKRAD
jgi:(+)-neomenthol dehydrogenase